MEAGSRDPRQFVSAEVWEREVTLLLRDHQMVRSLAERILGQAIAYLVTVMENRGRGLGLGAGRLVDVGVHTLILDTRNYAEFCDRHNNGRFLHHVPEIQRKQDGSVIRTAKLIEQCGFAVDWELWSTDGADCTPCRPGEDGH